VIMLSNQKELELNSPSWIPLNEFAAKYKVSLSTLRRRIRGGEVEHRFQNGKYWLVDQPISKYIHSYISDDVPKTMPVESQKYFLKEVVSLPPVPEVESPKIEDGFIDSANKLMQELKSAYVAVLHEKEHQIMQLREEVTNLKTLVKVLESENDRLSSNMRESAPIDAWLDKL
jgi:hypothetical protein